MKHLFKSLLFILLLATAQAAYIPQTEQNITGQATQTASGQNIVLATAGTGSQDCDGYRSVSVQITPTGTVSSGVVTFEASQDNTTFVALPLYDEASLTTNPISTVSPATGVTRYFTGPLSWRYFRARISTVIGGGGSLQAFTRISPVQFQPDQYAVTQATGANLNTAIASGTVTTVSTLSNTTQLTPGTAAANLGKAEDVAAGGGDTGVAVWGVRRDAAVASTNSSGDYSEVVLNKYGSVLTTPFGNTAKTFRAVANVALAVTATDIAILPGNATNTVQVTKITISGIETTAGLVDVLLIKRSVANSAGTSAAMTSVPLDASDAAAVSLPLSYTANPTPGAAVGTIDRAYVNFGPLATAVSPVTKDFVFGNFAKPIILSGTAQGIAVNLNGVTVTGGTATIIFEWIEVP